MTEELKEEMQEAYVSTCYDPNGFTCEESFTKGVEWAMRHFRVENPCVDRAIRTVKVNEVENAKKYSKEDLQRMDDARDAWVKKK